MKTAIAPSLTELSTTELKDLFDRSFESCHSDIDTSSRYDRNVAAADVMPMPNLPSDYEVAQVMLERKVAYWEHMGWVGACKTAINILAYDERFDEAQAFCQWLLESPPKGLELLHKELVDYAAGDFPVDDIAQRKEQAGALVSRIKANRAGEYVPNPVPIWKRIELEMA